MALVLLASIFPWLPSLEAQLSRNGFFYDDSVPLRGSATGTFSIVGLSITGSVNLADEAVSIDGKFKEQLILGTNVFNFYEGNGTTSGGPRYANFYHSLTLDLLLGDVQRDDGSAVFFYITGLQSVRDKLEAIVLSERLGYPVATTYNLDVGINEDPLANVQGSILKPLLMNVSLPGGIILRPEGSPSASSDTVGTHHTGQGPRNNDRAQDSLGARMHYGLSEWYRYAGRSTSFDELTVGDSFVEKRTSFYLWSPQLQPKPDDANVHFSVWGYADMGVWVAGMVEGRASPVKVTGVNAEPAPGQNAGTFGVWLGIGYGPVAAGISVDYVDSSGVSISTDSAHQVVRARVDFSSEKSSGVPQSSSDAIGVKFDIGATAGDPGFYRTTTRGVFNYYRKQCAVGEPDFCSPNGFTLASSKNRILWGNQAATWSGSALKADGFNYDIGDRAIAPSLNNDGFPNARWTYYTRSGTQVRHFELYYRYPEICGSHNFEHFALWWDETARVWKDAGKKTFTVNPSPCWTNAPIPVGGDFDAAHPYGQWLFGLKIDNKWVDYQTLTLAPS